MRILCHGEGEKSGGKSPRPPALKAFVDEQGVLPLIGSIPDMTSTTEGYLALQKLYQEKASLDYENIKSKVETILKKLNKSHDSISPEEIRQFCKNSWFLNVTTYRSLAQEYNHETAQGSLIASELQNPSSNMFWYVGLRAVYQYQQKHGKFPGSNQNASKEELEKEAAEVHQFAFSLLKSHGVNHELDISYAKELTRFGNSELHAVSGILGGVGAQEVIKLITQQYIPMNNTWVLNGILGTSNVFTM